MLPGIFALTVFAITASIFIYNSKTRHKSSPFIRSSYALGTVIQLKAFGDRGPAAINEAISKLNDIDDKMSAFKSGSDVSRININAGAHPQVVSEDTYSVLEKAVDFCKLTNGAFDPTIRPLVNLWNKSIEYEQIPDISVITEKLPLVNYHDILFDEAKSSVVLKNEGQEIDLGGIAKGFAADRVRDIFIKHKIKSGLIDLGGNIYALGSKPDGTLWNVGIQNPFKPRGQYLGVLKIKNESVVTSGNYEKYFIRNGKRFHHILDPKTGFPSDSRIISATVISENSIDGDGLSNGIYILGVENSLELIEALNNVDTVLVTDDREIYLTSGIKNSFELTDNNFHIEWSKNYHE